MSKRQFATLTAGLLARKGEATPAATTYSAAGGIPTRKPVRNGNAARVEMAHAEIMSAQANGKKAPKKPAPPKLSSVVPKSGQSALGKRTSTNCDPSCPPLSLNGGGGGKNHRAAVTLRLEPTRYLCLKMAAAKTRRTSQDILTMALDRYLKSISNQELDDCTCLKKLINSEPSFGDS